MSEWHLYLIRCADGSLYTGISMDVDRRFAEHQQGRSAGSAYCRGKGPLALVFQCKVGDQGLALKVERRVKALSRKGKEVLIQFPERIDGIIHQASQK
jgi:putative endonuclease